MRSNPSRSHPVIARSGLLALAVALVAASNAHAYDYGAVAPATPGTSGVTPGGVTIGAAATGATSISTPADGLSARGAVNANFTPQVAATTVAFRPLVSVASCGTVTAGTTTVCTGLGTMTVSFNRPVANPTLHIAGLGGSFASGPSTIRFAATGTLQSSAPAGATLGTPLAGSTNLAVVGGQFRAANDNMNTSCSTAGTALSTAGCGSIPIVGTVTSVTFAVGARMTNSSGSLAIGATAADAFNFNVSIPQDFGDAPASYEAGSAAAHDLSDLRLGATIDEDAATSPNPTASPNAVSPGTSASGGAGDGADDDAFTTWPSLTTADAGGSYAVTVPVSSVSASARLCGWIDFDRNGTFSSPSERACANVGSGATSAVLTWSVPTATSAGTLYTRLRLGYTQTQVDSSTGPADSGEVEDYTIAMMPSVVVRKTKAGGGADTFNLRVNGATQATAVGNGGATPSVSLFHTSAFGAPTITVAQDVSAQTVPITISEVASGGNQYGFTTTWSCLNGASATVASGTGTSGSITIPQSVAANAQAQELDCTFTNTQIAASMDINKTASGVNDLDSNGVDAGDTITYGFTVSNTGGAPLSAIAISDPTLAGASPAVSVSCPSPSLAVGASMVCTPSGPFVLSQSAVDGGAANNTATVSGTPPTGPSVGATDATSVTLVADPVLTLDKTAGAVIDLDGNGDDAGDTITYGFVVRNAGNVTVSSIAVTDPLLGAVSCPGTSLAPGAQLTCTSIVYTLTLSDIVAGVRTNTASAAYQTPSGTNQSTSDSTSTSLSPQASLNLDKTATAPNTPANFGDEITYGFVITNTGAVPLTGVGVTDTLVGAVTCAASSLAVGASTTCTSGTHSVTVGDLIAGQVSNTATATGTPPSGPNVSDSDTAVIATDTTPAIAIDKTASALNDVDSNGADAGDTISYSFVVTNTGGRNLTSVSITDATLSGATPAVTVSCPPGALAPNATTTCTASGPYTVTQSNINAGAVNNTANVTANSSGASPTASDATSTPLAGAPAIVLSKSASGVNDVDSNGIDAGDTITYSFAVQNTGTVTLTSVLVSDPFLGGAVACPGASPLAPGVTVTCTPAVYTLTQSDLDVGTRTNTGSVTATPPSGPSISDTDAASTTLPAAPAVAIDKSASAVNDVDSNGTDAGDTISYGFSVTNIGNVTLSSIAISDPLLGGAVACPGASPLAPGQAVSCPASVYTLTQADVNAGVRNNSASVSGTAPLGGAVTATDATSTALTPTPTVSLNKTAGAIADLDGNGPDAGDTISYAFQVTNTGNVSLTAVVVDDPLVPGITCPGGALAPGASTTCTAAAYVLTQSQVNAGTADNSASASAQPPTGAPVTSVDSISTSVSRSPRVEIDKTAGSIVDVDGNGPDAGDTIVYGFTVANTGNVTLTSVAVSDAKVGQVTCPSTPLQPGSALACTAPGYTLTQADVDAGAVNNVAFASAQSPNGTTVNGSDSTSSAIAAGPGFTIDKTASAPNDVDVNGVDAGDEITYGFTLRNTGNVTMNAVAVNDPLVGAVSCPQSSLPPGATMLCSPVTYVLTQNDLDSGVRTNTATANATAPNGTPVSRADSVSTALTQNPQLSLDKSAAAIADLDANGQDAGDRITYSFTVTNTGNVNLTAVAITDPLLGSVTCPASALAPGQSITCTSIDYSLTQADVDSGARTNVGRVVGTPPVGPAIDAFDATSTAITPGPAIDLNKTAGAITDLDGNGQDAGDQITYSFLVTNTGTVTLSAIGVTDAKVPGITCPVATLAPGASTTCGAAPYTLLSTDVDDGEVANTAVASGTPPSGPAVTGSDQNTAPVFQRPSIALDKHVETINDLDSNGNDAGDVIDFAFTATNTGNVSLSAVTITDAAVPALSCAPGTPATIAVGATVACTGSYTVTQPDVDAGAFNNTAATSGTSPGGVTVSANDSVSTPLAPGPAVILNKSAGSLQDLDSNGPDAGDTIAYAFEATNVGNVTLTAVGVTDALFPGGVSCPGGALVPGASVSCTPAVYTLTQTDIDLGVRGNSAQVSASPPFPASPVTGTDATSTPIPRTPQVLLDKTAAPLSDVDGNGPDVGDTITYSFTAQNLGNVTVTGLTISDPLLGTVTCSATTLAPGAVATCTAPPYTLTQADADAGAVGNTAVATASSPSGSVPPTPTSTDATSTPVGPAARIELAKTAGPVVDLDANGPDVGDTITYGFSVRNDGTVTLSSIVAVDALLGPISCPAPGAPGLAPGASITCSSIVYALQQSDLNGGTRLNLASVTSQTPSGGTVLDDAGTQTSLLRSPSIAVDKTAGPLQDATGNGPSVGDQVAYTFTVTNTGNVSLSDVVLTDPQAGPLTCPATTLEPGVSMACSGATLTARQGDVDAGALNNTAQVTATTPLDTTVTGADSTSTPIPGAPAIALDKNAGQISDLDGNGHDVGDTIAYTFVVTNTGNTTLQGIATSDPLVGGIVCPETSLSPGATMTCTATYVLTQSVIDAGSAGSLATVAAQNTAGISVSATDSTTTPIDPRPGLILDLTVGAVADLDGNGQDAGDTVTYNYFVTNSGNVTLTGVYVDDPEFGRIPCSPSDLAPGQTATCTPNIHVLTDAEIANGFVPHNAVARGSSPSAVAVAADDAVSVPVQAAPPTPEGSPAFTLRKRVSRNSVRAGNTVRYRLLVENTSSVDARGVVVCDVLPREVTLTGRPNGTLAAGQVCWTFDLPAAATREFRITVRMDRTTKRKTVTNRATLRHGTTLLRDSARVRVRPVAPRRVSSTVVTG